MKVRVAFSAPGVPPLTGASAKDTPTLEAPLKTVLDIPGSIVLQGHGRDGVRNGRGRGWTSAFSKEGILGCVFVHANVDGER